MSNTDTSNAATMNAPAPAALMVDAATAAKLCGLGRTTWYQHHAAGRVPMPIRLGGRVLWRRDELVAWVAAGCPARHQWHAMKGNRK